MNKKRPKKPGATVEAEALLEPVVRFLMYSGWNKDEICQCVEKILIEVGSKTTAALLPLENIDAYRELVSRWTTNPEYLDDKGAPAVLEINGKRGFKRLLKSVDKAASVEKAIVDLRRYGNVRRQSDGRLKLMKSFLHVSSNSSAAFEPHFQFLSHASRTTSALLSGQVGRGIPDNFWRVAEIIDLPITHAEDFVEFAKERSLIFLQELDEWLRAHSKSKNGVSKTVRTGVGLFSFSEADSVEAPKASTRNIRHGKK